MAAENLTASSDAGDDLFYPKVIARTINQACLDNGYPVSTLPFQQVLCLAEEVGEFVGAYRRWRGLARRSGTFADVKSELADVLISAYVVAAVLGIDLDKACRDKAKIIMSRGWRATEEAVHAEA